MKRLSTDRLLTLGMALYADKRTMEQRVRGIFGRKRTSGLACALAIALCLLIGVTCFTTACVPSIEEPFVKYENQLNLVPVSAQAVSETTPETPLKAQTLIQAGYSFPDRLTGDTEGADYRIVFDADVKAPDDFLLVESRCRSLDFSQAQIDEIYRYLCGDARAFVNPKPMDKVDYAAKIAEAEKGALVDGEYVETSDSQRRVAELKALQAAAPEHVERAYTDTKLDYGYDDGVAHTTAKSVVCVGVETGDRAEAQFVVSNRVIEGKGGAWLRYLRGSNMHDKETLDMNGDPADGSPNYNGWMRSIDALKIDTAAAEQAAIQALAAVGAENMRLVQTEDCIISSWDDDSGVRYDRPDTAARLFTFKPETAAGSVPILPYPYAYSSYSFEKQDGCGYVLRDPEKIQITIGDEGIEYFHWRTPSQRDVTRSDCPPLLSAEEVQSRATEALQTLVIPQETFPTMFTTITVRDMELIPYPVYQEASLAEYTVRPVWRVTCRCKVERTTEGGGTQVMDAYTMPSLLLDAADGTVLLAR